MNRHRLVIAASEQTTELSVKFSSRQNKHLIAWTNSFGGPRVRFATATMRGPRISQHCCFKFRCSGTSSSVLRSAVHGGSKSRSAFETPDWLILKLKVLQFFKRPRTARSAQHYLLRKPESSLLLCMTKRWTLNFDMCWTSNLNNRTNLNIFISVHFPEETLDQNRHELDNLPSY
jgi:hypothetical protein